MVNSSDLKHVSPEDIIKNPDNPRMIFREDEMQQLLDSIKEVGIKVPLSVYPDGKKYVIIDGERRWRCSIKLNLKEVPVIIQPKPTKLENILMMFNIHNVRVQWDLMPTALKLKEVKKLLEKEQPNITSKTLASITGLSDSQVKRCMELLELPAKYKDLLIEESKKPKSEQVFKPDLFLEIIKSKKAIERYAPEVFDQIKKESYLDRMVDKYQKGIINNVVKFREISKIARSEEKGVNKKQIISTLTQLAEKKEYKIETAYKETAELNYKIRDLKTKIRSLTNTLEEIRDIKLTDEILDMLSELGELIKQIIRR